MMKNKMKRLLLAPLLLTLLVGCGSIDKTFTELKEQLKERRVTNLICEYNDVVRTKVGIKLNQDEGKVTYTAISPNTGKTWTVPASFTNTSISFRHRGVEYQLDRTNGKIDLIFLLNGKPWISYEGSCKNVRNTKTLF